MKTTFSRSSLASLILKNTSSTSSVHLKSRQDKDSTQKGACRANFSPQIQHPQSHEHQAVWTQDGFIEKQEVCAVNVIINFLKHPHTVLRGRIKDSLSHSGETPATATSLAILAGAVDLVEEPVLDHLRHEAVDDLDGRLAAVTRRLGELVFRPLLVRVQTEDKAAAT